jgi:integrase
MDIHNFERELNNALVLLDSKPNILPENKKLIKGYHRMQRARNLSLAHQHKTLFCLIAVAELVKKPLLSLSREEVEELSIRINQYKSKKTGKEISEATKSMFKKSLKALVKAMNDDKCPEAYIGLKTITPRNKVRKVMYEDLLTRAEVDKMIGVCDSIKEKALISMLADTGMRVSEAALVRLRNVKTDDTGLIATVENSKTGMRQVRLKNSVPLVSMLLNSHPDIGNPDAFLFRNSQNPASFMGYQAVRKVFKKARIKAEIAKRCNPHSFRHTRATELLKTMPPQLVSKYLGVTVPVLLNTYSHLVTEDVDSALFSKEASKTQNCLKCGFPNSLEASYCIKCGAILRLNDLLSAFELMVKKVNDLEKKIAYWEKEKKLFELR